MMHAGLDLSRKRLEVQLVTDQGQRLEQLAVVPTADGLRDLVARVAHHQQAVRAQPFAPRGAALILAA